jgi:hypothetical protein
MEVQMYGTNIKGLNSLFVLSFYFPFGKNLITGAFLDILALISECAIATTSGHTAMLYV